MGFEITGIDHVQVAVPRAREAEVLDFYRNVLGLREIPKPPELAGRGGAWFQTANMQMHVGLDPDPENPAPRSKRHVCFLTADLAAAKHAAAEHGIAIEEESAAEGLSRIFIRDPAGNRIEIGARA